LNFKLKKHTLQFKFDAGTSRGVLREKDTWFVKLWDEANPEVFGLGECAPLKGLSPDDRPDFEEEVNRICAKLTKNNFELETLNFELQSFPSIRFGLETAMLDLRNGGKRMIFDNDFYRQSTPIPINGLIWMGEKTFMLRQIEEKLESGFTCLKMKIGALDFGTELEILAYIRSRFSATDITLRLDANGAFSPNEALGKLELLSEFYIHSIEQPIRQGQIEAMAALCDETPIPIALDEELIGVYGVNKANLLSHIKPQYIILKPTLLGGFAASEEWIYLAENQEIGWWVTSALESNIGLNAICQYTFEQMKGRKAFAQGLGTGSLYHNNIASPLSVGNGYVLYLQEGSWEDVVGL
jgi:o-succinylbenzoate synthase